MTAVKILNSFFLDSRQINYFSSWVPPFLLPRSLPLSSQLFRMPHVSKNLRAKQTNILCSLRRSSHTPNQDQKRFQTRTRSCSATSAALINRSSSLELTPPARLESQNRFQRESAFIEISLINK